MWRDEFDYEQYTFGRGKESLKNSSIFRKLFAKETEWWCRRERHVASAIQHALPDSDNSPTQNPAAESLPATNLNRRRDRDRDRLSRPHKKLRRRRRWLPETDGDTGAAAAAVTGSDVDEDMTPEDSFDADSEDDDDDPNAARVAVHIKTDIETDIAKRSCETRVMWTLADNCEFDETDAKKKLISRANAELQKLGPKAGLQPRSDGVYEFRPGQLPVIVSSVGKTNVVAHFPTGSGKTLMYWIVARLCPTKITLVVTPMV